MPERHGKLHLSTCKEKPSSKHLLHTRQKILKSSAVPTKIQVVPHNHHQTAKPELSKSLTDHLP